MLRLVIGRSKSGKTEEMIRLMRKCENAIYIVPEQYSFAAEKKITHSFGMSGMGYPSVYSFRRLAYYMEELYGGHTSEDISPAGRIMVLGDIVKRLSGELSLYGGAARRGDMASESAVIVTTFKQYGITKEKVEKAIEKTDNELLKKKLTDCVKIIDAYEEFLAQGYRDGDDLLEILRQNIKKTEYFKGKDVFIDSFQAFTPLEYAVIEELLECCRSVTVSLCVAEDGGDEFLTARCSMARLVKYCNANKIEVDEPVRLEGAMYTAVDELKVLESSFFDENAVYDDKTDHVRIHRAKNSYSECVAAALEIERLCREEGYRYRDIVIVARDMASYEQDISRVFDNFNIPLFMDKKTPLSNEAAAVFMLSAIKIVSRGWRNQAVFSYMKTAFSPIEPYEADELENYCIATGVRAANWRSEEDWDMCGSVKSESMDPDYLKRINCARRKLAEPLLNLEKKIKGKHTGRELCVAFYEFLKECRLEEKLNKIADSLEKGGMGTVAMRIQQVYELMIGVLESFDGAFGDRTLTSEDFFYIISCGIESIEIGVIPSTTDSVCAGSIDRAKGHGAKAVILIGAAEGVFPAVPVESGVFTNNDKAELAEYGIELPPDTLGKTYMEDSLVYSALSCATDNLYVSYAVGKDGANPSTIIKRLGRVFPNMVKTDELRENDPVSRIGSARSTYEDFVVAYAKMKKGEDMGDAWATAVEFYKNNGIWKDRIKEIERYASYENRTELIREELLRARYGDELSTSVSRLEQYVKCPFSYFASVTLGLKEREKLEVTAADSGTFLHEFVDLFGKGLEIDGRSWRDIDKEYIDRKAEEISMSLIAGLNRHLLATSPRVRHLFAELKRIAKRSVTALSEHMKKGMFEPLGYEIVFDKKGEFKPMTINLPNGQKALLRGRVDRADLLETHNGKFVRIIDYKSGEKKFSVSNIYYGFDLQLAVYLTTICEQGDYRPAGMLYFKIDDPAVDRKAGFDDETVEKEIVKKLRMDGLVLEDEEVLEAMDRGYRAGSDVIPVKLIKNGDFDKNSKVASAGEFTALSRHVKSTVKKLCNEILSGKSSISPTEGACTWCEMKSLCGFDPAITGCSYRSCEKINDRDALLKMIEEQEKKVQE